MAPKKSFTLETLAILTNCQLIGHPLHEIFDVADLESAGPQDASFFSIPLKPASFS
jgi:hypothetical protein